MIYRIRRGRAALPFRPITPAVLLEGLTDPRWREASHQVAHTSRYGNEPPLRALGTFLRNRGVDLLWLLALAAVLGPPLLL